MVLYLEYGVPLDIAPILDRCTTNGWAHLFTGGLTQCGLTCLQEGSHFSIGTLLLGGVDRAPPPLPLARGRVTSPFFSLS